MFRIILQEKIIFLNRILTRKGIRKSTKYTYNMKHCSIPSVHVCSSRNATPFFAARKAKVAVVVSNWGDIRRQIWTVTQRRIRRRRRRNTFYHFRSPHVLRTFGSLNGRTTSKQSHGLQLRTILHKSSNDVRKSHFKEANAWHGSTSTIYLLQSGFYSNKQTHMK